MFCVVFLGLTLTACPKKETVPPTDTTSTTGTTGSTSTSTPTPAVPKIEATPEAVKKAEDDLKAAADRDRRMRACLTFEDFEATVYHEPFEGGKYIVNGDTPVLNEKQLREFFEKEVKFKPQIVTMFAINTVNGLDDRWNQQQKRQLSYCVSTTFGSRHDEVVQQMANATGEWEKVADIHYIHDATQDANCGPTNAAVVFDVRPVNVNGEYLARAFFPNEPRASRNVLIDDSSFALAPPPEKLQLAGILRHELGHTIGARHEHTRPESGKCFEDKNWRPLTSYDAFSVMHYPQCNGKGDWSLNLTPRDKSGIACVYGAKPPFTIDPALVLDATKCTVDQPPPPSGSQPKTESFSAQSVAKDAQKQYGPFSVAAGSQIEAVMGGPTASGDPDLYVRFSAVPTASIYDCRPYTNGPTEVCTLTVPANKSQAFVMVRGYATGTYDLKVTYVQPAAAPPTGTH
jgi:hypothetical protein